MAWNELTKEEKRVIEDKGTEPPFSGEYNNHFEPGHYHCRRCDAQLFSSDDKFASQCGWPSFDDAGPEAVKRLPDPDGMRTEIVCANCDAHLGHVFEGEGYTEKNMRHCVNSLSLSFAGAAFTTTPKMETAYFAGGCFWGVEHHFKPREGVHDTRVGYMGGHTEKPTYEDVCNGNTGHAEVLEVSYDPDKISYQDLAKLFFEIHDPTHVNRQGPDIGTQYRSVVFYVNEAQKKVSETLIKQLEAMGYKVATKVEKAQPFWQAEAYHQDYYAKTGSAPYCHAYTKRFDVD